jgi:hypothetical protein
MSEIDAGVVRERLRQLQRELGSVVDGLETSKWVALIKRASGFTISKKTLDRYLAGENVPSWTAFVAIAKTDRKGRGPAWLAGWADAPPKNGDRIPVVPDKAPLGTSLGRPSAARKRRGA